LTNDAPDDIRQENNRPKGGTVIKRKTDHAADQPLNHKSARRLAKWLHPSGPGWVTERWFAWHASRELLSLYNRVHREEPQLSGRSLYEQVVVRRSGVDVKSAAGAIRRAEQSFCEWPTERDLKFREVVKYLIIDEYIKSHAEKRGTYTSMEAMVSWVIPKDL
jgi:hypothetical protein